MFIDVHNKILGSGSVRGLSVAVVLANSLAISPAVTAQEGSRFISVALENDVIIGEDSGFTNGLSIGFGRLGFKEFDKTNTPLVIRAVTSGLPIATQKNRTRGISHQFFQRLQTPQIIEIPFFLADDLPYAGLLAYQGTLFSSTARTADQFSLVLGIVGPTAFGEQAQSELHDIVGGEDPEGWEFQIRDTPVFELEYQRAWSLFRTESSTQFEVVGLGSGSIGNLETGTEWSLALRIGKNLGQSLIGFNLQADRQVNPLAFSSTSDWYAFVGGGVGYIATDIFVDGDLPGDLETNVTLDPIRTEIGMGVAYGFGPYALLAQFAANSTIIEEKGGIDKFGAISFTYRF